jgi:hypothetical protein
MSYRGGRKVFTVGVPTHTESFRVYDGTNSQGVPSYHTERVEVAEKTQLDVEVQIYVDDDPFNEAAENCRDHVNALTESVVAMEAAQVASISAAGKKVSRAIVSGFYNLVKSEISQQLAEMGSKFDALFARMLEISTQVAKQRETMEADYARICQRYVKLFDDLDDALNKRIRNLDMHAFEVNEASKNTFVLRFDKFGGAGTWVCATEDPLYQIRLEISSLRKRIRSAIDEISVIIKQEKQYELYTQAITHEEPVAEKNFAYVPVMTMTAQKLSDAEEYNDVKMPSYLSKSLQQAINSKVLDEINQKELVSDQREKLDPYFNSETEKWMNQNAEEDAIKNKRIVETLTHLWKNQQL